MDDRKLLYSLIEGVLIIYNEQKALNESRIVPNDDEFTAGSFVIPWRLIILMLTVWFLTILTWAIFSLQVGKLPAQITHHQVRSPRQTKPSKAAYAPNYHTHFHCNCSQNRKTRRVSHFSNEDLFGDQMQDNPFDMQVGPFGDELRDASQTDSTAAAEQANMQIATSADVYEISV
ncbi:uncharacterized protein LOC132198848 isoform X2 [Neocloeon triangulifer]|uniref:uncharacterized protein LOC132198848 isoform X2 n=1 Tax=Neocloeon triangulifer TaxID=2078957 RepID=UPI00286F4F5A|nr:uncharacterized protein LOC132198848 isoform X2 [Neocloeon triangulifer]